jgi:hypothetical protein
LWIISSAFDSYIKEDRIKEPVARMVLFLRIDLFSDIKEGIHPALAACVFWQVVLEGYRIVGDKTNKGGNYALYKKH